MATLDRFISHPAAKTGIQIKLPSFGIKPIWIFAIITLIGACVLQVVQTSSVTSTGYEIQRLKMEQLEWQAKVHQLEAESASLISLDRIEREARERLGMAPAERRVNIDVNVPAPAQQTLPIKLNP